MTPMLKPGDQRRHGAKIVTVEHHPAFMADGTRSDEHAQVCWFDDNFVFHRQTIPLVELTAK